MAYRYCEIPTLVLMGTFVILYIKNNHCTYIDFYKTKAYGIALIGFVKAFRVVISEESICPLSAYNHC